MSPIEKVKRGARCCCGKLVKPQRCQAGRCAGLLFCLFHRAYNRHRNRSRRPFFFRREAVSGQVAASNKDMLGDSGANAVQAMLADAGRPREGMLATFLGIGTLLFAAIGVLVQLKDALNTVSEVEEQPGTASGNSYAATSCHWPPSWRLVFFYSCRWL